MNKSKQAKLLGISRPTLYKKIKAGEFEERLSLEEQKRAIKLAGLANNVPPKEIDSILEFLGDNECLSPGGVSFATAFWEVFIKE